jgi:hypothetical protein
MNRPKENIKRSTPRTKPSRDEQGPNRNENDRSVPGRRNPAYEKIQARAVNEDEQRKVVNQWEDNAQSVSPSSRNEEGATNAAIPEGIQDEKERLEAGEDQSELNNRLPKAN